MTILKVVFANKDPLIAYHMLMGGGESISYGTLMEFSEYLEVYEAIKEHGNKEIEQEHKNKMAKIGGR